MTQETIDRLVSALKLLANEQRLRLLGLLADRERSVGELAALLELREPTVSHHLARLSEAGLVQMRREGNTHHYRLDAEALQRVGRDLAAPEKVVRMAAPPDEGAWERKVLGNFLDGERLIKIPDTRKKRDVILHWLAERFEPGRAYPEREVNEVIGRHHPDFATLRRELIGLGLMRREAGIYHRTESAKS